MKNILINNPKVTRDFSSTSYLQDCLINRFFESSLDTKSCEFMSDIPEEASESQILIIESVSQYCLWILGYFDIILRDNDLAKSRKDPKYPAFTSITVDSENRKARIHFYLDGDVFGLVVGSGYVNIASLIKASFPIFSKIGMDVEVKIFPLEAEK